MLRVWRDESCDTGSEGRVFADMPHRVIIVKMLRDDLEVAKVRYRSEGGRVADFHALRRTFATNLVKAGVDPKTAQKLMRHSTITLTMDLYTESDAKRLVNAVAALPDVEVPNLKLTG